MRSQGKLSSPAWDDGERTRSPPPSPAIRPWAQIGPAGGSGLWWRASTVTLADGVVVVVSPIGPNAGIVVVAVVVVVVTEASVVAGVVEVAGIPWLSRW